MGMFTNPYLLVPICTLGIAQLLKLLLHDTRRNTIDFRHLYQSGGMPSGHTAAMVSLIVTCGLVDGTSSPLFGLIAVLTCLVIYDALVIRRAGGEQGILLGQIHAKMGLSETKHLTKYLVVSGHTPLEVAGGILLGLIIGFGFNHQLWIQHIDFLGKSMLVDIIIIIFLLIVGTVPAFLLAKKRQISKQSD